MFRIFATTIVAAGLLSGGALAATVTETVSFTDPRSESLVFDPFDPALGTFSSASIAVSGDANIATGSIVGTTESVGNIGAFSVAVNADVSLSGVFSGFVPLSGPNVTCITLTPGDTCTAGYAAASAPYSLADTSGDAASFTAGTPLIDLDILTQPSVDSGSQGRDPTTDWRVSGTATLTYEYVEAEPVNVIPLPGALPLALGGVAVLGGLGFRRRNRHSAT